MRFQQFIFLLIKGSERLWPAVYRIRKNMSLRETNRAVFGRVPLLSQIVMVLVTFSIWAWSFLADFGRPPFEGNPFNIFRIVMTFFTFAPFLFGWAMGVRLRHLKQGSYLHELTREYVIVRPVYDAMMVPFMIWAGLLGLAVAGLHAFDTAPWQDPEVWLYWWAVLPVQILASAMFNIFAAVVASFLIWRGASINSGIWRLFGVFWGVFFTLFILRFIPFVGDLLRQVLDFEMHAQSWRDVGYAVAQILIFLGLTGAIYAAGDQHFERFCMAEKGEIRSY